jgi:hypothetical protein
MTVKCIGLGGLVVAVFGLGLAHGQESAAIPSGIPGNLPLYSQDGAEATSPYAPSCAIPGPAGSPPGSPEGGPGQPSGPPIGPPAWDKPSTSGTGPSLDGYAPASPSAPAVPDGTSGQPAAPPSAAGPAGPGHPQPILIGGMSSWLLYPRAPCCCGPLGHCGPIGCEIFGRTGIAFPVGGGVFGNVLRPGWDVEGGGRVLFFDPPRERAWTVMLSVSNIFNHANGNSGADPVTLVNVPIHTTLANPANPQQSTPVTQTLPSIGLTVRSYNQTFVNAGFGREWYLFGTADPGQTGFNWRIGADVGGRYGTAKINFNEIQHHTDVVGGIFTAIHSDIEVPWNCCIFQAGMRLEYNYIWDDALQAPNPSDYQSINLLFQAGARF